jgi:Mlc titration factor MtfA (ptsG expression regulator)
MFDRIIRILSRTKDPLDQSGIFKAVTGDGRKSLPKHWMSTLERDVLFYRWLPRPQRQVLHGLVQQFIEEKEFWGAQNHKITDEIKVYIAAHACLMILAIPRIGTFPNTREVIVYPSRFGESVEAIAPDGRVFVVEDKYLGQTWRRGPVLLAWDSIAPHPEGMALGHNTIYHEFAHVLDMLDGEANGAPPLEKPEMYEPWKAVMSREFDMLRHAAQTGRPSFIDTYGAQNPAEFFAVISEHFFSQPRRLERLHRGLYSQLTSFYRQDPAAWMR